MKFNRKKATVLSMVPNCKGNSGFSLVEVLLSFGLLSICFVAYMQFYANTLELSKSTLEKQDMVMLRQLLQGHFSCEKTLASSINRVQGTLTGVSCPGGIIGIPTATFNYLGAMIAPAQGGIIGNYKVVGFCDGDGTLPDPSSPVQVPTFRFFASPASKNLPLYQNPGVFLSRGWSDVLDGSELQCKIADDPGPPLDSKCSAMFATSGGIPTQEISGPFFRSGGDPSYVFWNMPIPQLVLRTRLEADTSIDPTRGKPSLWRMKYLNKAPGSIGTSIMGTIGIDPNSQPEPSPEFEVSAAASVAVIPHQAPASCNIKTSVSETAPVLSVDPACNYWEQKIPMSALKNPTNWYAAPLDLVIEGYNASGQKIADCATSLQLVSPLVLTWPKIPGRPEDLDLYTTATKFDISGNGTKVNTGWIGGQAAFLVLDRNQNNQVDDGTELFGDATLPPELTGDSQSKHRNGFQALAAYDDNGDRQIDHQDQVFSKLQLWFDDNSDGQSQPWELHKLNAFDVKTIGLNYQSVKNQPEGASMLTQFAYEASFFGPEVCGPQGCKIFDIYFATTGNLVSH